MWDPENADPNVMLSWEEQTATQTQRNGIGTVVGLPPAFFHQNCTVLYMIHSLMFR